MNKAVFLDRDGTINVEKNYLFRIDDFEFIHGATNGMKKLQQAGYKLVIITNQSGIARGYYKESDFMVLNDWMIKELAKSGIVIDAVYYCPHLPDAAVDKYRKNCNCRKPALGMYEQAVRDLDIDIDESWAIGDKIRDCAICEKTGCKGILIGNNERQEILQKVIKGEIKGVRYAKDLNDAARIIMEVCK